MEPLTLTAIAVFLAPYFQKAGEKLAEKTVEIALEKRQDIKDKFINLFSRDEVISLSLNDNQNTGEVKALLTAKPEIAEAVQKQIEANPDLLKELLEIIKQQAGNESFQITINAKNIGQVINNPTGNITQNNNWS